MKNFYLRLLTSLVIAPIFIFTLYEANYFFYFMLVLISFVSIYETIKNVRQKKNIFFLILVISFFIYSLKESRGSDYDSFVLLIWVISIVWISDIFGYIIGNIFKGPKLSSYSPNKTVSGFFGSIFFSQLSILIPFFLLDNFNINIIVILLQFFFCLISIFGDIFFSKIKRANNIKDYSALIPGHGGMLDRIDGLIFVIIIYYFIRLLNVI